MKGLDQMMADKSVKSIAFKKLFCAGIIACIGYTKLSAQQLVISSVAEKTVAGWQYGSVVSWQFKNKCSAGGFYQSGYLPGYEKSYAHSFYGITSNLSLIKSPKLNFAFNVRTGVSNQRYFVIVPGLETELTIFKHISISTVMSVRMSYPSAFIKLNFKI